MNIIDEFKKYDENLEETWEYINKHELLYELEAILGSYNGEQLCDKLFDFSFKYGVISIVKFMYEIVNYAYDINIFNSHTLSNNAEPNADINDPGLVAAVGSSGGKESGPFKAVIEDKYTLGRSECMEYLMNMRKYSEYYSKDHKFYFRYKKNKYGHK